MNILAVSSIFPIPGIISTNDFVIQTYVNYLKLFGEDDVLVIVPIKYNLNPFSALRRNVTRNRVKNCYEIEGLHVEVFRFLSAWRIRSLHSIITRSLYFFNRKRIKQLFTQYNFDVVHAQYIFSDGILANILHRKYRIPYFVNTHNERFYFDHVVSRNMAFMVLKNAAAVLPINYSNYLYFKSKGYANIERNTLGFDNGFIKPQKPITDKRISIVTVAELIKLKNIDKVIVAIAKLIPDYDITYTIIGKGPEKEYLESLIEKLKLADKIFIVEYVPHDQMANEMYKHDIFIMPSYFETFGRVYFEAMAMGIPVICAKNSGIYGLFKDGIEGIAVDHLDPDEIKNSLEFLVEDGVERLGIGRNGQELVKKYTWESIARDLHLKYVNSICT